MQLELARAAFAKMQAEKQRLEKDIRIMVMGSMPDSILVKQKYRKQFKFWDDIMDGLREIAKEELPRLKAKLDSNPKAFK